MTMKMRLRKALLQQGMRLALWVAAHSESDEHRHRWGLAMTLASIADDALAQLEPPPTAVPAVTWAQVPEWRAWTGNWKQPN